MTITIKPWSPALSGEEVGILNEILTLNAFLVMEEDEKERDLASDDLHDEVVKLSRILGMAITREGAIAYARNCEERGYLA